MHERSSLDASYDSDGRPTERPLIIRYLDGTLEVLSGWLTATDSHAPDMQYRARIGTDWLHAEMRIRTRRGTVTEWETMRYIGPTEMGGPMSKRARYLTAVYLAESSLEHSADREDE